MGSSVKTWEFQFYIEIGRHTKMIDKKVKDYNYRERLKDLRLSILPERRMKGDLIENFKIINEISNNG